MTLIIDKNNIEQHHWVLDFLIADYKKGHQEWQANKVFYHNNRPFQFGHLVMARKRKNGGVAFEMMESKRISRGYFASVYRIHCTLSQGKSNNSGFQAKNKDRVVKDQGPRKANEEYLIAKDMEHLHAKEPVNGRMVMKNLGFTLSYYLHISDKLSRKEKLALCKAILKAYKEQLVDKKVYHDDLWKHDGNMLVREFTAGEFEVNIIDFGESFRIKHQDYDHFITPDFRAIFYNIQRLIRDTEGLPRTFHELPFDFDDLYNCFNNAILAPTLLTQEPIDNLLSFLEKLKERHPELFKTLKQLIDEAAENSNLENGLQPLKEAVLQCRLVLKERDITEPSFPVVVFETDEKKQALFNNFETYFQRLEAKGEDLYRSEQSHRGKNLYKTVQKLREATLDAIYNSPAGLNKKKLQDCHELCKQELARSKEALGTHRNSNYIWAEIGAVFGLLIIGYLAALGFNYWWTNRIGLFTETRSLKDEREMDENFSHLERLLN